MEQILVIGGTDSTGGAGVFADSETIHSLGGHCFLCVSAVTVQGSKSPFVCHSLSPSMLQFQLDSMREYQIDGIKIGMLPNRESVEIVASFIEKISCTNVVLDPVLKTSLGEDLCSKDTIISLKECLFPLASLVTPNLNEANVLTSKKCSYFEEIPKLAEHFLSLGVKAVLIKGGHLKDNKNCKDYLLSDDGNFNCFENSRIPRGSEVRGTGCRLASAITSKFISSVSLTIAVGNAIDYVRNYISRNVRREIS